MYAKIGRKQGSIRGQIQPPPLPLSITTHPSALTAWHRASVRRRIKTAWNLIQMLLQPPFDGPMTWGHHISVPSSRVRKPAHQYSPNKTRRILAACYANAAFLPPGSYIDWRVLWCVLDVWRWVAVRLSLGVIVRVIAEICFGDTFGLVRMNS